MQVRDWSEVDFYAVLGVDVAAPPDTIAEAYRTLAKQLHPDVGAASADALRFAEITAAYDVLSDAARRRDYDRVREGVRPVAPRAPAVATPPRWSPARQRWFTLGGCVALVAGVAFSVFIVALQARERADLAARAEVVGTVVHGEPDLRIAYQPRGTGRPLVAAVNAADATAVDAQDHVTVAFDPERPDDVTLPARAPASWTGRVEGTVVHAVGPVRIAFAVAPDLAPVVVEEPARANGGVLHDGGAVPVLFDPEDPTDVRLRESTLARDLTFWIIAIKLLVAGPVLIAFGRRHRHHDRQTAVAT
jgi:hypothetical protein